MLSAAPQSVPLLVLSLSLGNHHFLVQILWSPFLCSWSQFLERQESASGMPPLLYDSWERRLLHFSVLFLASCWTSWSMELAAPVCTDWLKRWATSVKTLVRNISQNSLKSPSPEVALSNILSEKVHSMTVGLQKGAFLDKNVACSAPYTTLYWMSFGNLAVRLTYPWLRSFGSSAVFEAIDVSWAPSRFST